MNRDDSERLLATIHADIERLEKEMARLRDLEAYLLEKAGLPPVPAPVNGEATPHPSVAGLELLDAAERLLREEAPLTIKQIVDGLIHLNYPVPGPPDQKRRKLANLLYTGMQKRPERFRRVRKGVWDLADRDAGRGND